MVWWQTKFATPYSILWSWHRLYHIREQTSQNMTAKGVTLQDAAPCKRLSVAVDLQVCDPPIVRTVIRSQQCVLRALGGWNRCDVSSQVAHIVLWQLIT